MPLTYKISFDTKMLAKSLDKRLGLGSPGQYAASKIIFDGTRKYVPASNERVLETLAQAQSRPLMAYGQLVYPAPYAHYLWVGLKRVDPVTGAAGFLTPEGWRSRKGVSKVRTDVPLNFDTM